MNYEQKCINPREDGEGEEKELFQTGNQKADINIDGGESKKKREKRFAEIVCKFCKRTRRVRYGDRFMKYCSSKCAHICPERRLKQSKISKGRKFGPLSDAHKEKMSKSLRLSMEELEARFWGGFEKRGDCWIWIKTLNHNGYGTVKSNLFAHRFSYEIHFGKIPEGLFVLHKCDTPSCVNPEHLFIGTIGDNNRDKKEKNRDPKGSRHWNTHLSESDADEIRTMVRSGVPQREIGIKFGIHQSTVSNIKTMTTWKHKF